MTNKRKANQSRVALTLIAVFVSVAWSLWYVPASDGLSLNSESVGARSTQALQILGKHNLPSRVAQTVTWDGEGATDNWSESANWNGTGIVPQAGDDLVFPGGPTHLTSSNDLPSDTIFQSMSITGNGYTLSGNSIRLNGTLTNNNSIASGTNTINLKVTNAGGLVTNGLCSFCRLRLTANNEYTGATTISGGVLTVNGNQPGTSVTTSSALASLEGIGTVGAINAPTGSVRPGDIFGEQSLPGSLKAMGNVTFTGNTFYMPSFIAGAQSILPANVDVTGIVTLNNSRMFVFLVKDAILPVGERYTIINNDGTDPVVGTFLNHPEGSTYAFEFLRLRVSYRGGDGNDVTLRRTSNTIADFDYDGRADVSVFRPSEGTWYLLRSTGGFAAVQWGIQSDRIVPADFDGDGKTDVAVYRPTDGTWYILQSSSNSFRFFQFGIAEDIPRPGDYDGDGDADFCVFRPSTGTWYRIESGLLVSTPFGQSGDIPVLGDFVGNGKSDIAVFRPSNGTWYVLNGENNQVTSTHLGQAGDVPTVGDYDGDGRSDLSVFRPSDGNWYRFNSSNGAFVAFHWGQNGDIPAAEDFDDDGVTDFAIYRPSDGSWYISRSRDGFVATQFGASQDVPVPSAYQ